MGALSISGQMGVGLAPHRGSGGTPTPTPTPAPAFSIQPSISGTPQVGVPYVGTPGAASNTTGHTYRWLLATTSGGTYAAIVGATGTSYTPVSGDATKYLKFEDTATGPGGSTVATTTFAGPVAAAAAGIDTPILANLSSGWTSGQNPPAWQSTYPNVQGYAPISGAGDQVRARWRLDGGAWTTTAWEPLDDELATGDAVPWPFLTDGSLNAGGVFDVQEQIVRDLSLGTEQFSAWSSSWTNTISAVVVLWAYNAAPTLYSTGFGTATPVTFAAEIFGAGTGIVAVAAGNNPPASVTIAGAAMTLLHSKTNGNDGLYLYAKTGLTAGAKDIVITPSTMNARNYGIATGTLSSTLNATPASTAVQNYGFNGDPQTSGTFTLPAGGVAIALVGLLGNAVVTTWDTGFGSANTERHGVANGDFQFATASMIGGASSATGQAFKANGYNFIGSMMAVVVFGP